MKIYSLIFLILFAGYATANPKQGKRIDLGLTEEQQTQMQLVHQRQKQQLQEARDEIMAQSNAEMATFLTAEQLEKVESMQQHRQEHGQMRQQHKKMKRKHKREERSD